jgi:23S rRNA pseudouridine2605 synthase
MQVILSLGARVPTPKCIPSAGPSYNFGVSHPPKSAAKQRMGTAEKSSSKRTGLARVLSKLGFCSRSQAAELIRAGRVTLNGAVRRDPESPVRLDRDRIQVDGLAIASATKLYWMLNKPRGVVTTASDERGRETVYHYMDDQASWLAPVGRLDKASEGLLLLTNDSEWAARILSPEAHIEKTYHVQIGAVANEELLEFLRRGVHNGGDFLRATRVNVLRSGKRNSWLEIVLDEGKNRQIRRMLEPLGVEVLRLVRVAIGPLALGDLRKGAARPLTREEKLMLDGELTREVKR